jgi:hypothetical protein
MNAKRKQHVICAVAGVALAVSATAPAAQRRAAGQARAKQPMQVSLKLGGETYQSNEPGACTHAPKASIYQVVSEMWSVQQTAQGRSLSMSLWKPADRSADMVTLSVTSGSTSHEVNTVRGGGAVSGSGRVNFQPSGNGGTFTLDLRTKNGVTVSGTIRCDAIAPHMAEGG